MFIHTTHMLMIYHHTKFHASNTNDS